jgi:hypothetical protein
MLAVARLGHANDSDRDEGVEFMWRQRGSFWLFTYLSIEIEAGKPKQIRSTKFKTPDSMQD